MERRLDVIHDDVVCLAGNYCDTNFDTATPLARQKTNGHADRRDSNKSKYKFSKISEYIYTYG